MEYTTIGIDVSKNKLDVCFLPTGECIQYANNSEGFREIYKKIKKSESPKILIESTGSYHKSLYRFFITKSIKIYIVNPKRIRDFAKASGTCAKTDKLDACIIAQYGERMPLQEKEPADDKLKLFVARRRQLVLQIATEKNHLETAILDKEPFIQNSIKTCLCFLEKQLSLVQKKIVELITESRKCEFDMLTNVSSVGAVTAITLLSDMPELGKANKRQIAALAGVAPMNCDSGNMRGQRHIRGGRPAVRAALYMSAISGIRCNPVLKEYYGRLRLEGKPFKVAITAVMRKLLLHLNALMAQL